MRTLFLAAALTFAAPAVALAGPGPAPSAPAAPTARAAGLEATFQVSAPAKPLYTCPMHPEVTSAKATDTCPKCKMDLEKQTHHVVVTVRDAQKKPVSNALVRLTVKDAHGMLQGLNLKGDGTYAGSFHLPPGKAKLTAFVMPKGASKAVDLSVPYEVK